MGLTQIAASASIGDDPPSNPPPHSADETTAAAEKARETGKPVELESQRDANSTSYINPDGSTATEITGEPTRVEKDGEYVPIDPSLSSENGVLVPEATTADVEVSDGVGDEPLAQVKEGPASLALDWPTELGRPEVDGAEATYAAGTSRDIQVTATNSGFNLRVVLNKIPSSPPIYKLPVSANGVQLVAGTDGGFLANNDEGKTVFRIVPPLMWDHSQDGLEAGPELSVPVDAKLVRGTDGGQVIELRPSWAWLTDRARVLPITIDPDTYVDNIGDKSTYVMSSAPSTSYGTANLMRAGYDTSIGKTRSYILHSMPARVGGQVKSASLKLYQYDANSCTPTTLNIYPVTSNWTTGMTWSGTNVGVDKQPSVTTSSAYASSKSFAHGIESTCANATETIDVTKMVRAWMNDEIPNYGMALRASETDQTAYKALCSFNFNAAGSSCNVATRQPTLTITYNTPPAMVTDTLTTGPGTVCKTGADRPVISSSTPTLRGSATDVDIADGADQTRIRAEVWAIEGSAAVTSGYAPYVTEGTITSWTVPTGALVNGTYKWRAQSDDGFDTSPYWSDWCEFTVDSQLAPAHEQTDLALRTFYEHTIGAGPTASEAQLRTTPQGQAALSGFLARQDTLRAEHVAEGILTTSVVPSLIFTGAVVVASDTVTFPVTTAWTTNRLIAGSNETSAGNDNWMVTLRTVDGLWALDNLVQPVIPQDESQLVIDPNEPVQEALIGQALNAPGSNRALRATPSSASVTNTGVNISAMVAYAFKWSGTAVQHGGLFKTPTDREEV